MDNNCPVCGAPFAPGEKFCQNCGNKLPTPAPVEAPTEVLQETPVSPIYEAPAAPEAPVAPVYEAPAAPVYEAPAAPVYEAPAAPVPPAAPAYKAPVPPVSPVYAAPAAPMPPYGAPAAPNYPPQPNVPNYAPKAAPVPPAAPQYAPPPYGAPAYAAAPAAPKKKKTGLIIGLCAGAAVLIAAAVMLYFFVFSPSSVTLSETAVTMEYLDSYELTAEVSPGSAFNKSLTWTSSDEDVATVWGGTITAWSAGTCEITATTSNGKSATCTVTVIVEPYSVYLSNYWVDLEVGEKLTLEAEVYPENANDKSVTWSSSDSSVATVVDGIVVAVGEGSCEITATTHNGISESCTVDVSVPEEPTDPTEPPAPNAPLSKYEEIVVGEWHLTYVWDDETYEDVPAENLGVTSKLTFNADRTAKMTLNDESYDQMTWEYYETDEEGDYLFYIDDGEDMYFYYIVEYDEIWVYIDDEILTYER